MLFNSFEFIFIFLPIALIVYFTLAKLRYFRLATTSLVIASLTFYAQWDILYLPLLLASIIFNYIVGSTLERNRKKYVLYFGVFVNLLLLGYFKYAAFFLTSWNYVLGSELAIPNIVLPLGISFFTFTQTAYLIDAYRGETKGYSFLTYCLFVTVFPHLIAGPILYHKHMIPQFTRLRNFIFSYKNFSIGITIFSIGLFKKVVIADSLAPWVKLAFDNAERLTFLEAWAGALAYTFQLYFDFSGYSEMAVGLGLMLNLKLPVNFNSPYQAVSIIDFWRRWHITLSEFLKNYLYIPLGGNRRGKFNQMKNIVITMTLGGLWHGAGWTFVAWGALHGFYLAINHAWRRTGIELPGLLKWALTFVCVVIGWVFFRAETMNDALSILYAMAHVGNIVLPGGGVYESNLGFLQQFGISFGKLEFLKGARELAGLLVLIVVAARLRSPLEMIKDFKPNWKWACMTAALLCYSLILMHSIQSEFLYFQF